jgi:hypothetical protein
MPRMHKINAAAVFVVAVVFYWFFMFCKHDAALSKIIPFGDDPYDAVGSFAIIIGILAALLSLFRAFRPYPPNGASIENRVYLVRAQTCVVLTVFITLVADAVAMGRHASMWKSSPERNELILLLAGMAIVAISVESLIRRSAKEIVPARVATAWIRAVSVSLVAVLLLALYPERLINGIATHLLTVVVGALILFVPMRPLLTALVPYEPGSAVGEAAAGKRGFLRRNRWGIVLLIGVILGVFYFAGEMSEGTGGMSIRRIVFVGAVFVGLSTIGLAIAYTFLGIPLGLGRRS